MKTESPISMRAFLAFFSIAIACTLSFGCTAPPRSASPPAVLAPKLKPEWIASAKHFRGGDRTIYYRGHASNTPMNPNRNWSGSIQGEVLVLDTRMAIVIPSGEFALRPDGAVHITGQHTVITDQAYSWKHLLLP